MLIRILGEVLVGLMAAGLVNAIAIPTVISLGYTPQPWLAWVAVATSIGVCVVIGERMNKGRRSPESS